MHMVLNCVLRQACMYQNLVKIITPHLGRLWFFVHSPDVTEKIFWPEKWGMGGVLYQHRVKKMLIVLISLLGQEDKFVLNGVSMFYICFLGCLLGHGCIVAGSCRQCSNGQKLPCIKSNTLFAHCQGTTLLIRRCLARSRFDPATGTCRLE